MVRPAARIPAFGQNSHRHHQPGLSGVSMAAQPHCGGCLTVSSRESLTRRRFGTVSRTSALGEACLPRQHLSRNWLEPMLPIVVEFACRQNAHY
jgi:hypothetical protein